MKKSIALIAIAAIVPMMVACDRQYSPIDLSQVKENPFAEPDHAVSLVAEFGGYDFGKSDPAEAEPETIEFENVPTPTPDPLPDAEPDVDLDAKIDAKLGAFHDNQESLTRGKLAKLQSDFDGVDGKLSAMMDLLKEVKRRQLTKADVGEVMEEKLEAFKQVLIEWKGSDGKVSSASVSIDESGSGVATLPPGATITSMGGVPVEQWRVENPGSSVPGASTVLKSGGSTGGQVVVSGGSNGTVSYTPSVQYTMPMASSYFETEPQPVASSYYEAPGQFSSSVVQYPNQTEVALQVDDQYLQSDVGSNWTTSTDCVGGNCPTTSSTPRARKGPLRQLFGR